MPMKMEMIEGSETSAYINQTPGNYPKGNLLNIFLSKISRTCSSFFVNLHASASYDTTGLISVLYNMILDCNVLDRVILYFPSIVTPTAASSCK